MHRLVSIALLVAAPACTHTIVLRDPHPILVTARAPRPQPPAPAPVVIRERIVVKDSIFFDTNLDTIRPESRRVLDDVARIILDHPELVKIRIEGHTDSVGTPASNLSLSKRRATSVRGYLVNRGVDADRLISEGYGGTNPIATNTTDEGRAKNRRVVFSIVDRTDGGVVVRKGD